MQRSSEQKKMNAIVRTVAVIALSSVALYGCDRFKSADDHAQHASELFAKGDARGAMASYKEALQKDPEHVAARVGLGRVSWWLGDLDSAEKEVERAISAGAEPAVIRSLQYQVLFDRNKGAEIRALVASDTATAPEQRAVWEGRAALLEKDTAAARTAFSRALSLAPSEPEALLEMARLEAAEGRMDAVLQLPDKVRESPETYARALYLRGAVQASAGTFREARETLEAAQQAARPLRAPEQLAIAISRTEVDLALGDADAAERNLARVEAWAPKSVLSHFLRARVAVARNDFVTAVAESQRALRLDPNHVQSQLLLASSHYALGALEQALDVLRRLLASNPDSLAARKLLAQVHLARDQPEEAQRVLGANAGGDADADWLMGSAMLRSGSISAGIEHLESSIAADPGNVRRRIDLANAYIAMRQSQKAIDVLADVPAESPLSGRAKMLTVLASAAGKPRAQAREQVNQLVAKNQDDAGLLSAAGTVLASLGDVQGGRKVLESALEVDPKAVDPHLALARLAMSERKLDEAQQYLGDVLTIDPKHEVARLALAEIAWNRGDRDGTRKWLEEAITTDPAAVEARLRLAQLSFVAGDGTRARGLLSQAIEVSQDRKSALRGVGRVLARAGFSDEALARFQEASAAGDRAAMLDAARLHLDLNDLSKARETASAALAAQPKWREAEQLLVLIDARDRQFDRAFERARGLLPENASKATVALLKGDLHALGGDHKAASEAYESAQGAEPSAQTAIKLFEVRRAGGLVSPEQSLIKWLERTPQDANVRRVLALHYETSGQNDLAVAQYERLLASDAMDPLALNNLAWALHMKDDPRALELARRAHEAAPQYPEIADTYGWILVRMGKVADGLVVLQSAVANAPTNPDILYHAAAAYRASGDSVKARELVNEALKSTNDFASRADAVRLARELSQSESA